MGFLSRLLYTSNTNFIYIFEEYEIEAEALKNSGTQSDLISSANQPKKNRKSKKEEDRETKSEVMQLEIEWLRMMNLRQAVGAEREQAFVVLDRYDIDRENIELLISSLMSFETSSKASDLPTRANILILKA